MRSCTSWLTAKREYGLHRIEWQMRHFLPIQTRKRLLSKLERLRYDRKFQRKKSAPIGAPCWKEIGVSEIGPDGISDGVHDDAVVERDVQRIGVAEVVSRLFGHCADRDRFNVGLTR